MNDFQFQYPTKVYFGKGCVGKNLAKALESEGDTVLFAYGGGSVKRTGVYDEILGILQGAGKNVVEFSGIMSNPTYEKVQEGANLCRDNNVDFILAVGGGSVIDCCKIVSAQAKTDEDMWEKEFTKRELPAQFLPMGAIVTVSGTGSEMNNGAVITNEDKHLKSGMLGAHNTFAMLDPAYTLTVPFTQVLSGAFDSLSHAMETYFGAPHDETNLSDGLSESVMRTIIANMRLLKKKPDDYGVRSELEWASAMAENGILKIGKVTDFQCHQIEHQLGAYTNCNHGLGLAVLHPVLYRHIYKDGIPQFRDFAMNVWGVDPEGKSDEQIAREGVEALAAFIQEMGLPTTFSELGIPEDTDYKAIADSTNISPGCCKQLDHGEILEILEECR